MTVKNAVRRQSDLYAKDFVKTAVWNVVYFICGLLVSKGAVLGSLAPFGASFAAAVPKKFMLSSLFGTALGYIMLSPSDSFRYIAVICAIGGMRWLMSDISRVSKSPLFPPLVAFFPILATGIALTFSQTSSLTTLSDCVIEAVLAGAAAYFLNSTVKLSSDKRSISAYSQQETASFVMTGCILILAFGSISLYDISLGRIMAVVIILLCARYGSVTGGAICGIATGAVFSISSRTQGFLCGGFGFGGMMSGLFAPVGKLGCAIVFVIANSIMCLAFDTSGMLSSVLIESLIGSVVFMILPKEVGNFVSPIFSNETNTSLGETLRKNVVMRLDFAAKAISNVKNDVNRVSEKMKRLYSPTFEKVCENVEREVCGNCGLKMYCLENQQGVTHDDFHRLEELLNSGETLTEKSVESVFVKKCCKKREIAESMNSNYREYLSGLEAQRRVDGVRGVVAGQFSGVSDILRDMSREFESVMRCDTECADRIIAALSEQGVIPTDCICSISDGGRMKVEIELSGNRGQKVSKGIIMRTVSKLCGRRFDLPTVSKEGDRVRVALCELPVYDVEIGTDQHIANDGRLCGDCLNYFNDGFGKTYAIVCDGMGTGGRAAVDSNMAVSVMSRLLSSGLSPDSSLQIVNSALMVKSEDESLSTVDVTSVDLFTGKVTLKKAGAPLTYIKRGGRVTVKEMPSLPAGILNDIRFSSESIKLTTGDMVVMVSDGVFSGDERWLENLIRTWNEGSAQELAHAVVVEAMKRRGECREDDITALAIRLTDNK